MLDETKSEIPTDVKSRECLGVVMILVSATGGSSERKL